MQTNNDNFKSYTEQVPFNNIPCKEDEILERVVAAGDMLEYLKDHGLDTRNIRKHRFPYVGKKVPVAFVQIKKGEEEIAKKRFNEQVHKYFSGEKSLMDECESIDELIEKSESIDDRGYDPTGDTSYEMKARTAELLEQLISDVSKADPKNGIILQMLYDGAGDPKAKKKDILDAIGYTGKKSAGYELIEKVRELAEYYYHHYCD